MVGDTIRDAFLRLTGKHMPVLVPEKKKEEDCEFQFSIRDFRNDIDILSTNKLEHLYHKLASMKKEGGDMWPCDKTLFIKVTENDVEVGIIEIDLEDLHIY